MMTPTMFCCCLKPAYVFSFLPLQLEVSEQVFSEEPVVPFEVVLELVFFADLLVLHDVVVVLVLFRGRLLRP